MKGEGVRGGGGGCEGVRGQGGHGAATVSISEAFGVSLLS